ncbi:hydantoinase/oxoprolinase family protein [Conexibacter woesei]|uniref:5-oxoprolinase (ATP-hydrolyzing) n=1 Tax=Conexibacter woesei (strain DSM 14684 / CCUG 47730 / CIP 108061 / JCM 11494 / NBRC 100937 / ID131577) TaxID=469383 RepID=D3F6F1_CONWI|nr:5-oxoprolinase (ATP-hydrolyzing) [Conexibacter woesei DSM 14684]
MTFAIDAGGTFTDLVLDSGRDLRLFKAHTTPHDPVEGVLDVLAVAAAGMGMELPELLGRGQRLVHGTTRAINALVTGATARTGLLCTEGHPDVLVFREGGRTEPFDFTVGYPRPLVPRALTAELPERITAEGTIFRPLDEARTVECIGELRAAGVEAVGVSLLWSIVNPAHELRVGELLDEHLPGVPYTLSHQLNPTLREYRRTSSTCIDASLKPVMADYFASLEARLAAAGFGGRVLIVTSSGGMLDAADLAAAPIHSINSGPSMAPVAGRHYAALEGGHDTAIVADTGGTTFDVSVVRAGSIPRTRETWIGPPHQGHITGFPSVDVKSVGAGGGSIAWVDDGGLPQVGPHSAASQPGPACYGRGGTEPTLTDACLVVGHLAADSFLAGAMRLDADAARSAVSRRIAEPLGLSVEEAAAAIVAVATENMVHAIEEVTVHQGIDPRAAVLVGGGGAAGLNLVAIAARLGCPRVLIPETGAALSAAGGLLSDVSAGFAATHVTSTAAFDFAGVERVVGDLRERCAGFLRSAEVDGDAAVELAVEARYPRQNWEIEVPIAAEHVTGEAGVRELVAAFHRAHERLFAISDPDSEVEIITWRAEVCARATASAQRRIVRAEPAALAAATTRPMYVRGDGWVDGAVAHVDQLADGVAVAGPAVIGSSFTTVVVDRGFAARRSPAGSLVITREEGR